MRRALSIVLTFIVILGAGALVGRLLPKDANRVIAFDLAERLPYAARSGPREFIAVGWPDAERYLASGFGGDPESRGRDRFQWVRQGATLRVPVAEAKDRVLVFDIEAYEGIDDQALAITVNGRSLGLQDITRARSRVRFDWPAIAQKVGVSNDLLLRFAKSIVPARQAGGSGDTRDLAGALFSVTIADASDATIDLLRERETPRGYEIAETAGIPSIVLAGGTETSFAFRLPSNAALEFEASLHPWSAASGGSGVLRVVVESTDSTKRGAVDVPLQPSRPETRRIEIRGLPGTPTLVRLSVTGEKPGVTFATLRAPRVTGAGETPAPALSPTPNALADALAKARPNVLLVVLDAARAQSFGAYGYTRETTPNIDAWAKDGFVFDNAYTTGVYTLAAMSSIWTSQQPDRHHGAVAFSAPLPRDRLTVAEVLTAQGVPTAGFVANSVAGAFNGFDRGFKEFIETWKPFGSQASGFRNVLPGYLDRMKANGTPFFAYVHYREPHHPYDPPPPFTTRFGPDGPIPKRLRSGGAATERWLKEINQGRREPGAEEIDHLRRLYDGNLAFADQEIGWLRAELQARGLLENTLVILTGDHGEALYEHGYIGHNTQVYEESARVPLIIALPKAVRPLVSSARVGDLVGSTDIGPTILEAFGLSGKGGSAAAFRGRSLLSLIRADAPTTPDTHEVMTRTVWSSPVYAVRDASYAFIYNTGTSEMSLFDRTASPRREDRAADYAPRAPIPLRETYRQDLLAWIAAQKRPAVTGDVPILMKRAQCEEMKALGYLDAKTDCSRFPD